MRSYKDLSRHNNLTAANDKKYLLLKTQTWHKIKGIRFWKQLKKNSQQLWWSNKRSKKWLELVNCNFDCDSSPVWSRKRHMVLFEITCATCTNVCSLFLFKITHVVVSALKWAARVNLNAKQAKWVLRDCGSVWVNPTQPSEEFTENG